MTPGYAPWAAEAGLESITLWSPWDIFPIALPLLALNYIFHFIPCNSVDSLLHLFTVSTHFCWTAQHTGHGTFLSTLCVNNCRQILAKSWMRRQRNLTELCTSWTQKSSSLKSSWQISLDLDPGQTTMVLQMEQGFPGRDRFINWDRSQCWTGNCASWQALLVAA